MTTQARRSSRAGSERGHRRRQPPSSSSSLGPIGVAALGSILGHDFIARRRRCWYGDRRGEPDLPLRLRRHGLARARSSLYGISAFVLGNVVTSGQVKGLHLGWTRGSASSSRSRSRRRSACSLGAVAGRSAGIYFLMITLAFAVLDERLLRVGDDPLRLQRRQRDAATARRALIGNPNLAPEPALLHRARRRDPRLRADPLPRPDAVRDHAAGHPRRPGADGLARLQRRAPPDAGDRLRGLRRLDRRDPLRLVVRPRSTRTRSTSRR